MATLDDVARMAADLPEAVEGERHDRRSWSVGGKVFAWERAFSKADVKRYGDEEPPEGPILATRVADLGEKEAILAEDRAGFFTIPHFDGFPAVLIQLSAVADEKLREAVVDGWLALAPAALTRQYLETLDGT
jgi:hypothetical protein